MTNKLEIQLDLVELRDRMAMAVLPTLVAATHSVAINGTVDWKYPEYWKLESETAYAIADAMMAARRPKTD